ncbi:MAG: hypothetical protein CL578_15680 [Alteromonadaceae bacterium]|uniref:hypothetical protein n=1 Tax=Paraglaciecola chathamensis TaxID=368405 RepID=UPI000C483A34|nr:hypothetical protein [Paraglaciecola agarilytica]MBN26478.1 hypothetical protein [Alteromonadaceae bacterium]|tara:strand:+ start:127514 stop:127879 length:366 start_codon:yes stop_codon:yes gene_type:complete
MYTPRSRFNRSGHRSSPKQNENIDKQIRVLHQAMALKLIAQPQLRQQVIDTIESRYQNGLLRRGGYLVWICLMECIEESPDDFIQGVIADTPQMRKLRRKTPFINVLTEQERQHALHNIIL